jgi:hypothetical protein
VMRQIPCGSFVYIRDANFVDTLYRGSEKYPEWEDEQVMAAVTDDITGGWQGPETYCKLFEPYCYTVKKTCAPPDVLAQKTWVFRY